MEASLEVKNKPSSSCLATRIATDKVISREKLVIIEKWVIELAEVDFERFAEPQTRLAVSDFFNDFNIEKVYVDVRTRPPVES
jgi:PP-loop superfamily ATP-utilizing enzyme